MSKRDEKETPAQELQRIIEESPQFGCGCCAQHETRPVVYEDGWEDEEYVPRAESITKQILAAGYVKAEEGEAKQ